MENNNISKINLIRDSEWSIIDGEICKIIDFTPLSQVREGKIIIIDKFIPYACITIECKKIKKTIKGFITHKTDFLNLWEVFKKRTISNNEEVIIFWTTKYYKNNFFKFFSKILPKLKIIIYHKGAFELLTNQDKKIIDSEYLQKNKTSKRMETKYNEIKLKNKK